MQEPGMAIKKLIPSAGRLILSSALAAALVLALSFFGQWLVYEHWLHEHGPLRVIGTVMAAVITFAFVLRWQYSVREQQREMVHRLERILNMNDKIRNALQAIECVTYLSQPEATETVRQSVKAIDAVLGEVIEETNRPALPALRVSRASAANRKSA